MLKTKLLKVDDMLTVSNIGGMLTIVNIDGNDVYVRTDDKYQYTINASDIKTLYRKNELGGKSAYIYEGINC